ncbi:hypothetical protein [Sphingobium sp. PAMC28499]|uniref:hypothetical protein n=1 Tax=Sphingobium sp. PAMC28499 TaxID=2565554 RepID=UPI001FF7B491|nr:hypothetical protein [Sphingobium sp. PAMC28499]
MSAAKPASSNLAFMPSGGPAAGIVSLRPLDATSISIQPTGRVSTTRAPQPAATSAMMASPRMDGVNFGIAAVPQAAFAVESRPRSRW